MSNQTVRRILELKSTLVEQHGRCNGSGYLSWGDAKDVLVPCDCMIIFQYLKKLIDSGIPEEYWFLNYQELKVEPVYKRAVDFYIQHIDNAVRKSSGILFLGHNGVGKTSLMCEIGKHLVVRGYSSSYFTIEEYVNAIRAGRQEDAEHLCEPQALLIDELGKVYEKQGSTFVIDTIESCIRRYVVQKPVIMCSNFSEGELRELLGDSTLSVLERHLKFIEVEGKDYSKSKQDRWKEDLSSDVNYHHPNILKMAISLFTKEHSPK